MMPSSTSLNQVAVLPDQSSTGGETESNDLLNLQESILGMHFQQAKRDGRDTVEFVDSVLAKEFNKLSVQERSKTYEELHGVDDSVEETPLFVQNSLRQLDDELARIKEKPAYDTAEQQDRNFVTDPNFRLMFLRADSFHPKKAATRLVGYFEGKLKYFGIGLLTKRIQLSDLDHNDQICVRAGHMQVLPSRDRSGRAVFADIDMTRDQSYMTAANRLKAYIFFWLMMAEDEENQKRGVVLLIIQLGSVDLRNVDPELPRENPRLSKWLPLRCCALHLCSDDNVVALLFRTALVGAPSDVRARHRFHHGPLTEIMYSLLGYGIPVDVLPLSESGVMKKTNLNRWIAKYIARDEQMARTGEFSGVDLPTRNDVLTGKGKPIQHHPGNVHLRMLVETHMEEYKATKLSSKMVADKVFAMIKARPGRFLQKDSDGWWRESSDADALDKVNKTFLTARTKQNNENRGGSSKHFITSETSIFLQQGKRARYDTSCCWHVRAG